MNTDEDIEQLRVDAVRYRWLKNGGWEVMQDPKYWTPENRFDGAIDAGMLDVSLQASQAQVTDEIVTTAMLAGYGEDYMGHADVCRDKEREFVRRMLEAVAPLLTQRDKP